MSQKDKETEQWFEKREWTQGWQVSADESIDKKEFEHQYFKNPESWNKAFSFMATTDLKSIQKGRYELDGTRLFVNVDEYQTKDEEETRFEAHRKYADLQYIVSGEEQIGVVPLETTETTIPYDETKDIAFLTAPANNYRLADSSKFFVFFPHNAHRPGYKVETNGNVKKIVVKILINE